MAPFETGAEVHRTGKPNDYLIAPLDLPANEPAPRYELSARHLFTLWCELIEREPRTRILVSDPEAGIIRARQRSRILGFGDRIAIHVLERGHAATFLAHSHSETGYFDFGVNRRRLKRWLKQLEQRVKNGA